MRILVIRLKNLASLEGSYEIDFNNEPLYSAGIFAITGPTGAGKSTILDAICLALYAKTPRNSHARELGIELQDISGSSISQGDVKGILRKGTVEGYAEVEFLGIDGDIYRSRWSVRRAYGKMEGSLQPDTMELINVSRNLRFPEKKIETLKEIERVSGLNFDQFTRSVLLAQGEFTAFLKADRDEKSALLEKLTGVDIYSNISRQVFSKFSEAKKELERLEDRIAGIQCLSEEDEKKIQEQLAEQQIQLEDLVKKITETDEQINWRQSLVNLQETIKVAEEDFHKAEENLNTAGQRKELLKLVEDVQEIKPVFEKLESLKKSIEEKFIEKGRLLNQIEAQQSNIKVSEDLLNASLSDLQQAELIYKNSQASINKAKELDALLQERNGQFGALEADLAAFLKESDRLGAELLNKGALLLKNIEETEGLNSWINQYEGQKNIAENIDLIRSKLEDLSKILGKQDELKSVSADLSHKISTIEDQLKTSGEKMRLADISLQNVVAEIDKLKSNLGAANITDLYKKQERLSKRNEAYSNFRSVLEKSISAKDELLKHELRVEENEKQLQEAFLLQQENAKNLAEAQIKKDLSIRIFERLLLESAQNIETLRSSLKKGDPCPVCGSLEHPYAQIHKAEESLLKVAEEEKRMYEQQVDELNAKANFLKQQIVNLEADKKNIENQFAIQKQNLNDLTKQIDLFNLNNEFGELKDNVLMNSIDKQIVEIRNELSTIFVLLNENAEKNKRLEELLSQFDQQSKSNNELEKEQRELKFSIESLSAEQERSGKDLSRLEEERQCLLSEMKVLFRNDDWFEKWMPAKKAFEDKIEAFSVKWFESLEKLDAAKRNAELVNEQKESLKAQIDALRKVLADLKAKKLQLENSISSALYERNLITGGRDVASFEKSLLEPIELLKNKNEKLQSDLNLLKGELLKNQSFAVMVEESVKELTNEIENTDQFIKNWIIAYNGNTKISLEEIVSLFKFSGDWIKNERETLREIENNITKYFAVLEERKLKFNECLALNLTSESLESLSEAKTLLLKQNTDLLGRNNDLLFLIRQNEQNKNILGEVHQEHFAKKAEFENWFKLNEVIGSADGKKFRLIAQEYTLDALLGFANLHLCELSHRYKLERVPDSLALQVVDQDMGDEIRSVHSLSGGESFLVSLALALGLASLSSNKMKIESLFIDEGFGSLDPVTLNVAMDALERLRSQGRKVSVISHVQEMTERIHARIVVSRVANGKSKIEIAGGSKA